MRTFAHYVRDGLIPNMFPEGRSQGLYHTADATLWFFNALHRYVQYGLIPCVRVGRRKLFRTADLVQFAQRGVTSATVRKARGVQ